MGSKLTSALVLGGIIASVTTLPALTGVASQNTPVAATANPSSTSDGTGDNANPYTIITDRNIFRLNPIPPPPVAQQKPAELPKIYLNGIFKIGDQVRVLFSIPPKDAKSQTSYFKLAPNERATGEKDDVLELVNVHPDQQGVDVIINGTAMTLTVQSNSLATAGGGGKGGGTAPAAAPAAAVAAAPGGNSSVVVAGGDRGASPYGGVSVSGGGGGVTTIGGNNSGSGITVAGGNGAANPASFGGGGVSVAGGGGGVGGQIANALFSGTPSQVSTTPTAPAAPPEVQAIGLLTDNANNPDGPPLPPTLAEMVGQNTGTIPTKGGGQPAPTR